MASLMLASDQSETLVHAQRIAAAVLGDLESRFSSYRADSELSRFAAGQVDVPSAELRHALAACEWLSEVSGGVFTTTTTHEHDLAGYVKGWAVDQAAEAVAAAGIGDFALGVGGDWRVVGHGPDGRPWRFGILNPTDTAAVRALADIHGAIATSGLYERGEHLRRTESVYTSGRVASFTVVGPRLAWADAFATIGFLLGDHGLEWVAGFHGYSAALIRDDGHMVADESFPLAPGSVPVIPGLAAPYA